MALATYSDLQASIARWLRRTDLTSDIPDFITLFEAQANRAIRCREMVGRATATISSEYEAAPGDFAGPRSFKLAQTPPTSLEWRSIDQMDEIADRYSASGGSPVYYSIVGTEFRFLPVPSASLVGTLTYWKTIPALSDGADTNWLLTNHPDVYLYGSLLQSAPFLKDDNRLVTWAAILKELIGDLNQSSIADEMGAVLRPFNGAPAGC